MARPLSIDEASFWRDPLKPDSEPERVTKGEVVIRAVRQGLPDHLACQVAGIHRATLSRWKASVAEAEGLDDSKLTDNQRRLRQFRDELSRAEAEAAHRALAVLEAAALQDWRAALAMVERRFPRDFSKRIEVKTDPVDRKPATADADLASRAQETFLVAALPDDLEPDDFLPPIEGDAQPAEAEASA